MMKSKLIISSGLLVIPLFFAVVWLAGSMLSAPANQPIGNLPADLSGQPVQFSSSSGARLHGWLIPGKKGAGVIMLMHGVRASRLSMLDRARFLSAAGYSVLLFDFQAHGESTGAHITFGYLESKDAQAAVSFLQRTMPDEKIGVIGVSLGGAAALLAAPPLNINALVLEMVYPTINQAITNRLTMRLGAAASVLTPLLSWQFKPRLGVDVSALRPLDRVAHITTPKLFIAGADDRHTTLDESLQLFHAASDSKELWIVEGAKHTDLHLFARKEYEQRVLSFFEKYLRG